MSQWMLSLPLQVRATLRAGGRGPAMWSHRPFRADEWLLYAQDIPNAAGARGQVFTQEGELVVSVVREGLIRTTERDT
jgi:acyl-CoA thioesterase